MSWSLDNILRGARELGATDIHLVRNISPAYRVAGDIRLAKGEPLDEPALRRFLGEIRCGLARRSGLNRLKRKSGRPESMLRIARRSGLNRLTQGLDGL